MIRIDTSPLRRLARGLIGAAVLFAVGVGLARPVGAQVERDRAGAGDQGPRAAELVRLIQADSTRSDGLAGLLILAEDLPASQAAPWLELVMISGRVPDSWLSAAATAMLRAHDGDPEGALDELLVLVDSAAADPDVPEGQGLAPLLGLAAGLARSVDPERAARLHERLLEHRPESIEAPRAALELARYLLDQPERAGEGLALLEELLVRTPTHPVAPQARRLRQAALARGVVPAGSRSPEGSP